MRSVEVRFLWQKGSMDIFCNKMLGGCPMREFLPVEISARDGNRDGGTGNERLLSPFQ